MSDLFLKLEDIVFSKDLYISGNRALNINDRTYHTGDWHTIETWDNRSKLSDYHIFGNQSPALINTIPYLKYEGIFDATTDLDEMGVQKFSDQVFAADHARAIADLVIAESFNATILNGSKLFRFISLFDLDDYMPNNRDKFRVYQLLDMAIETLPAEQAEHVKFWLDKAKRKNYE